jgi:hypothetical protein
VSLRNQGVTGLTHQTTEPRLVIFLFYDDVLVTSATFHVVQSNAYLNKLVNIHSAISVKNRDAIAQCFDFI